VATILTAARLIIDRARQGERCREALPSASQKSPSPSRVTKALPHSISRYPRCDKTHSDTNASQIRHCDLPRRRFLGRYARVSLARAPPRGRHQNETPGRSCGVIADNGRASFMPPARLCSNAAAPRKSRSNMDRSNRAFFKSRSRRVSGDADRFGRRPCVTVHTHTRDRSGDVPLAAAAPHHSSMYVMDNRVSSHPSRAHRLRLCLPECDRPAPL